MTPLVDLVRRHGCTAKLVNAVRRERGWKSPRFGEPGVDDWYANWPEFSLELEAAVREARDSTK